ncbi:hypothetical protein [Bacteroides fluxus]|uniref:Conserved domain protein n=1 Tax=Bacteroides fluxus YIT 12057 TaxID=763034 RepID=F3PPJ7_9BACE|nr:hypothetical protein [Bacteroides fluxus]EGF59184.1 conserved domain protein [Bacteroides fluxus YIT 12057]
MRTTTFAIILAVCALLTGCKNSTSLIPEEEKLVGKYYTTLSHNFEKMDKMSDASMQAKAEIYSRYNSDRTCHSEGIVLLVISLTELKGFCLSMEFKLTTEGTWKIEDGYIKEKTNPENIKWTFVKSNADNKVSETLVKAIKTLFYMESFSLKESIMQAGDAKIVEFTDEKLVVEQEGEQMTMTRIE